MNHDNSGVEKTFMTQKKLPDLTDLKKTYMYNAKLTQELFDLLEGEKHKNDIQIAAEVESMFQRDLERKAAHKYKLHEQLQQLQIQKEKVRQDLQR